jgi:signal transduction histidine kinase/CheY-like chemotaxis protein
MQVAISKETRPLPSPSETQFDKNALDELRAGAVVFVFGFIFLVGVGMVAVEDRLGSSAAPRELDFLARYLDLLLVISALTALALHSRHYRASVWVLAGGCASAILIAQLAHPDTAALTGIAFVIGLIGFFIGKRSGLAAAAGSSALLLLLAQQQLLATGSGLIAMSLLLIWGMTLLVWTAIDPLHTVVHWSWYYFAQARDHAEAARDRQAELGLAYQDLAEANRQLAYLNRLVHAAQAETEEAARAKVEFVANVSHELRTPLNMIIGFSETLLEAPRLHKMTLPPAVLADIAAIHRNGCHLQNLIDDVLDLSQIDMGRMALRKERTDLKTLVADAVEAVRYLYESKKLALTVELAAELPETLCDRTRIREVLLNLLSNAGRFTERGGVIVRAWQKENRIVVAVVDTGPGIAPAQQRRIFEPFQQLDDSIRRRFGGSGLGLVISRAFVEMHGGRMWLESEIDQGSTFFFDLPLPYRLSAPGHPTASAWRYVELRDRPPRAPMIEFRPRFVVLGENQMLQRLLVRYLSAVDVMAAPSLAAAVTLYEDQPYQAIVANAETPEQVADFLAQRDTLPPHVPLLLSMISANKGHAQLLGVTDYLVKPITRQRLMAALAALPQPVHSVLVADDDTDVPQLFDRMLALDSSRTYRLLQAINGYETLHLLRTRRPDVLLLDLAMPGLDGYQVLKEKNADPAIRAIPVLVISARDLWEEPLTSTAIIATRREGISVPEVINSVAELSEVMGLLSLTGDRVQPEKLPV